MKRTRTEADPNVSRKILYVNACVRKDSRTKRLADRLISRLGGDVEEIRLEEIHFGVSDEAFITKRDCLLAAGEYDDPMFAQARAFASADLIVIAAPFWDLSFPAALKQYLEQINAIGITFRYTDTGDPQGLCRADRFWLVTAYDADKETNSVIYVIDKENDSLVSTLTLPYRYHSGGIAFDGERIWLTGARAGRNCDRDLCDVTQPYQCHGYVQRLWRNGSDHREVTVPAESV